ncbi:MAG: bifunctional ADP-dependent NAD(P)H-hydrate dehydratase/NAD(P)H-hydrate epimerase, partial [bacterium]|nr:bifunctional ADP-dependent NAD(P)H-hydrate dehydratase/NAD(P)H-hydrate epimerase [bacterium]
DDTGVIVLLKGNPTFVLGAEQWVVTTGGAELATIGTGDVLSGVVAALWSGGLETETAARSGAFWHGIAGAALASRRTVTATELVHTVGEFL